MPSACTSNFFLPASSFPRYPRAWLWNSDFGNYGNPVKYNGHFDLRRSFWAARARTKVDWDSILLQNSFRSASVLGSIYDFVPWIRSNRRIHFSGVDEYSVTGFSKSRGFRLLPLLTSPALLFLPRFSLLVPVEPPPISSRDSRTKTFLRDCPTIRPLNFLIQLNSIVIKFR